MIIVGGGISGLAAAHFYRERAGGSAKILILENHDDFGGHAKRNEFHLGGKLQLLNGGTMLIDSPTPYSPEAAGLMKKLGIDAVALDKKCSGTSATHCRPQTIWQNRHRQQRFGGDSIHPRSDGSNLPCRWRAAVAQ